MWCMMSTPLMIGCDLTKIKEETLAILKNKELIALNQDSACKQAYVIKEFCDDKGELLGEIWLKELGEWGTEKAVAFLNRSGCRLSMELSLEEAGLLGEILEIRDLWEHTDCECKKTISVEVEPHGTLVYRIKSETGREIPNKDDKGEYHWKPIEWIDMPHMEQLVEEGALLVDVRTEQEYAQSHLSDAMNVPYMDMHAIAGNYFKDKSQPLVLYCATGKRSSQAKQSLEYLGYEKVYLLKTEGIL